MAPVAPVPRPVSWMARGACRLADPELFFPIATAQGPAKRQAEAAKAVCAHCPVRTPCLSYALELMPEGIWGGTTTDERRAARRRLLRHQANARSAAGISAPMTGESATYRGLAAERRITSGRSA